MKIPELYNLYANCDLTTCHYKILFLLLQKDRTQIELSRELEIAKQNINKACKDLTSMDLIQIGNTIGRNKYLKINKNPSVQLKGQQRLL